MKKIFSLLVALFLLVSCDNQGGKVRRASAEDMIVEQSLVELKKAIEDAEEELKRGGQVLSGVPSMNQKRINFKWKILEQSKILSEYEKNNPSAAEGIRLARSYLKKDLVISSAIWIGWYEKALETERELLKQNLDGTDFEVDMRRSTIAALEDALYAQRIGLHEAFKEDHDPFRTYKALNPQF